jgi:hypothetical protein
VELSLNLHPNETPRLFYIAEPPSPPNIPLPPSNPAFGAITVTCSSEWALLSVRECSVSSLQEGGWSSLSTVSSYSPGSGGAETADKWNDKRPFFKPAAVAAIGPIPLVLVYGWGLFGFIYSWRSSLNSLLSSYLICLSCSFSIFLHFYLLSFLSYLNFESSLVRFIGYHRMSWSRMLSLSSPWPPTNGAESISAGPRLCCVA